MAKKKKKTTAAAAPKDQSTTNAAVVATSYFAGNHRFAAIIIGAVLLFITLGYNFKSFVQTAPSSFPNKAVSTPTTTTTTTAEAESTGELFLNWFVDNGGIFHPISTDDSSSSAVNDNNNVQITIQKFDGMGWGLAAVVSNNATSSSFAATATAMNNRVSDKNVHDDDDDDENICENTQSTKESCSTNPSSSTTTAAASPTIIIPHLAPLFTVPSHLIISISSILDIYSSPTTNNNDYYLPNFYTTVNQVLLASFPRGVGLTKMHHGGGAKKSNGGNNNNNGRIMGLVEQDVVIAMMLMTEQCLHDQYQHQSSSDNDDSSTNTNNNNGSFWGPYLNMLPTTPIPRLDTFDTEEYTMLNDDTLEMVGRSSKQRLMAMFHGGDVNNNNDGKDVSIKAVVRDMIHIRQQQRTNTNTNNNNNPTDVVPSTCLEFETFHKFIGIVSSRAMVLKGIKYLTPLAEMMNYKPVFSEEQVVGVDHNPSSLSGNSDELLLGGHHKEEVGMMRTGGGAMIHTPFDLYHTIGEDDSITVRSDRNVMLLPEQQQQRPSNDDSTDDTAATSTTTIQIFEDYGPVDSSLFLEMHAFVPSNNPYHCAIIHGKRFLRRPMAPGRSDPYSTMLLRALKVLHLTNPQLVQFDSLEDVCVREDMSIVEDGSVIGRRPASDAIAILSLLLGEGTSEDFPNLESLKSKCIAAIESNDVERIELRCARYPGSRRIVKQALVNAANRSVSEADVSLETLLSWVRRRPADSSPS